MNNVKILMQLISTYSFFCHFFLSKQDLLECEQSMQKMAERGRREKDGKEIKNQILGSQFSSAVRPGSLQTFILLGFCLLQLPL